MSGVGASGPGRYAGESSGRQTRRPTGESHAAKRQHFPDADLVNFVSEVYGPAMGCKCEDIFNDDPKNESGFANSIRRSLTRELDALIQEGKYQEAMRDA